MWFTDTVQASTINKPKADWQRCHGAYPHLDDITWWNNAWDFIFVLCKTEAAAISKVLHYSEAVN